MIVSDKFMARHSREAAPTRLWEGNIHLAAIGLIVRELLVSLLLVIMARAWVEIVVVFRIAEHATDVENAVTSRPAGPDIKKRARVWLMRKRMIDDKQACGTQFDRCCAIDLVKQIKSRRSVCDFGWWTVFPSSFGQRWPPENQEARM